MSGSGTHDAVQRASTKEEERTAEAILDVDELYELPRQARDVLFILLKEKSSLSIGDIRNIYMQYLKDLSIEFKLAIWKSCGFTYNRLFNLAEYKPLIDKLDKFDPLTDMLYSYISGFVDQKHNIKKWKHENDLKEFEQVLKLRPFSFGKIDLILTSLKNRPIPLIVKEEAENQKESAFYKPSSLLRKAWLSKKEELYKRVIKGDAELLVKARGVEYLAFYDIKIEIADYLPTDGIKALFVEVNSAYTKPNGTTVYKLNKALLEAFPLPFLSIYERLLNSWYQSWPQTGEAYNLLLDHSITTPKLSESEKQKLKNSMDAKTLNFLSKLFLP